MTFYETFFYPTHFIRSGITDLIYPGHCHACILRFYSSVLLTLEKKLPQPSICMKSRTTNVDVPFVRYSRGECGTLINLETGVCRKREKLEN